MHEGEARSLFMAYHLEILKLSPHGLRGSSHRRFVFCKRNLNVFMQSGVRNNVVSMRSTCRWVEDWDNNKIIICISSMQMFTKIGCFYEIETRSLFIAFH
ncbi:uncharacterized protein LOC131318469 isoform X2 [Rhododendron vialii]|uniref:uncharacterized protein LOC131318469 isoform X2 n=1 Tax=Rhododendron vialii TaxID=182163 RepID=UPI00265DD2AB|nr:uncharacterized protein LOC131318469 isoform X2 [Rhododendron vialii]